MADAISGLQHNEPAAQTDCHRDRAGLCRGLVAFAHGQTTPEKLGLLMAT
jgi:hypothetical protein